MGDPSSVRFTKVCESIGWKGEGTSFDLLPLVIQCSSREPRVFDLPKEFVLEVPICHPELDLFRGEEVKWYAVPIISDMRLEIGGISYAAAPFNGWYMGTEIGARNLADEFRYNLLPRVAEAMGLDMTSNVSLWKDRALVELNVAVLHSFEDRDVTGRWSWLIPPLSPATTDIFHSTFYDRLVTPNFFHQPNPYLLGE